MCNVDIDSVACDLVSQLIGGIVETLSTPSVVNMGFREFARIIRGSGFAILGTGETNASDHPEEAVRNAFSCPLLHVDHDGFTGAYLHIRGDGTLTRAQASKVAELISGRLDLVHGMVFGATVDPSLSESLRVTLMLTGVRSPRLLSAYSGIMNLEHEHTPEWEQEPAANLGSYQLEDF
jgi:cell division protein FtsZ